MVLWALFSFKSPVIFNLGISYYLRKKWLWHIFSFHGFVDLDFSNEESWWKKKKKKKDSTLGGLHSSQHQLQAIAKQAVH